MPRRTPVYLAAAVALASACPDASRPREPAGARPGAAPALDVAAWTRMDPAEFGCWMEKALGYRDARWRCASAPYPEDVDPCDDAFADGPALPEAAAARLHPLLRRVALAWEGGALQAATFTFAPGVGAAEMARIVGAGEGVASAAPGACASPCFVVTVFDPSDPSCDGDDDEDAPR